MGFRLLKLDIPLIKKKQLVDIITKRCMEILNLILNGLNFRKMLDRNNYTLI